VARFKLLSWLFDHPNRSKLRGIHFKVTKKKIRTLGLSASM